MMFRLVFLCVVSASRLSGSPRPRGPRWASKCRWAHAMAGLTALVFSIVQAPEAGWGSARTIGGIAAGLAVLAVFAVWELRKKHPMLDPRHFRSRRLSAGSLSIFIQFFAFFGFTFTALQYLQGVRGDSPLKAALSMLPLAAVMMPTARVTPKLADRFGAATSA